MQNLAFTEVSGGPHCNSNVNSRNKKYAAKLIYTG